MISFLWCLLASTHPITFSSKPFKELPEYRAVVNNIDKKTVLWLYQILKDITEIFDQHHLIYWIDGGTLLGAVRHKGLIPWDDDLDICILKSDKQRFEELIPILHRYGYGFEIMGFGYKVFPFTGRPFASHNGTFRFPFIDIFFMIQQTEDAVGYDPIFTWGYREGKPIFYKNDELFPLIKYQFGSLSVYGPNNPIPYFNALYGTQWDTVAIKYNHVSKRRETVALSEQEKVPAQPTEPLENRIIF